MIQVLLIIVSIIGWPITIAIILFGVFAKLTEDSSKNQT